MCYVYGYNFPKHRGGPMHYADAVGLKKVKETLLALNVKPAKLLEDCIAANMTLAKYWKKHGGKMWAATRQQVHYSRRRGRM